MQQAELITTLAATGIIPVIEINDVNKAVPLGQALHQGGIAVAEITLRNPEAMACLAAMHKGCPEVVVGAGTVLNLAQAQQAVDKGAQFIISPGLVPEVIRWCLQQQVPVFPGICTPSEVCQALDLGVRDVKFFPASQFGGAATAKALTSVFSEIRLMPTGGINLANAPEYLRIARVLCCGGSFIVAKDALAKGDFAHITALAQETMALVQTIRPS